MLMRAPSRASRSLRPFEGSAAKAEREKDESVVTTKERFGCKLCSVCERYTEVEGVGEETVDTSGQLGPL